jgi:hypothetical protein
MRRKELLSFAKKRKWYLALLITSLVILIPAALAISHVLVLESEKNLDRVQLATKIQECLKEKSPTVWSPSGEEDGNAWAAFAGLSREEVLNLTERYGISLEYSSGNSVIFNMHDNLPVSRICSFLNDDNVTSYGLEYVMHGF